MGKTTQVLIQKQKAESCNTVTQQLMIHYFVRLPVGNLGLRLASPTK